MEGIPKKAPIKPSFRRSVGPASGGQTKKPLINPSFQHSVGSPSGEQTGATHLIMVLILLGAATLFTLTVARTGVMEQRMSANEYQHKRLRLAAEAGLAHGIAWLAGNLPDWQTALDPQGWQIAHLPPSVKAPDLPSDNPIGLELRVRRSTPYSPYVEVTATASNITNTNISITVQQYAAPNGGPIHTGIDLPPLIIEGCLGTSVDATAIYPRDWQNNSSMGSAIQTGTSKADHCIHTENLRWGADAVQYETFKDSAWDYVFRKTRDQLRGLAEQEAETGIADTARNFIWETGAEDYHGAWGSPSHPVIRIYAGTAGCPWFSGRTTVYGIVYIDGDCPEPGGLGPLEVYGSLVIAGDVEALGPGIRLHHFGEVSGGPLRFTPDGIATVAGTWRDF